MKSVLLSFIWVFTSFSGVKIVGGEEAPLNTPYQKSTVALIVKYKGEYTVSCTGTLVAPKVVLTAAHCLRIIVDKDSYVAQGVNPMASTEWTRVSHLIFNKYDLPGSVLVGKWRDIGVLLLEEAPVNSKVSSIGHIAEVNEKSEFIQMGYGLQFDEPTPEQREYPFYGKLMMLENQSFFESAKDFAIDLKSKNAHGTGGGDSGGPLFIKGSNKLYGVLSTGSEIVTPVETEFVKGSHYVSPYYFVDWINSLLPPKLKIQVDFTPKDQFLEGEKRLISAEDFPAFNRKTCQEGRQGWDIDESQTCWPATQESCEKFERERFEIEQMNSGLIYWDVLEARCKVKDS